MRRLRRRLGRHSERGAALVEFALILPIFMMMVLAMFTGGTAYNQRNSITNAVREASRYGATLAVNSNQDAWLRSVAADVRTNATGDLNDSVAGRRICVAYVYPQGTNAGDTTRRLAVDAGQDPQTGGTFANSPCTLANGSTFVDGLDDGQRRVDVVASRSGEIQALLFKMRPTLQSNAVTRFEAVATS